MYALGVKAKEVKREKQNNIDYLKLMVQCRPYAPIESVSRIDFLHTVLTVSLISHDRINSGVTQRLPVNCGVRRVDHRCIVIYYFSLTYSFSHKYILNGCTTCYCLKNKKIVMSFDMKHSPKSKCEQYTAISGTTQKVLKSILMIF